MVEGLRFGRVVDNSCSPTSGPTIPRPHHPARSASGVAGSESIRYPCGMDAATTRSMTDGVGVGVEAQHDGWGTTVGGAAEGESVTATDLAVDAATSRSMTGRAGAGL